MESIPEDHKNKPIHFQKINIFGDSKVGKSSLIECMDKYNDDNFKIEADLNKSSRNDSFKASSIYIEQIRKIQFNINENRRVYYNIYETSMNSYNEMKLNLEVLLEQTECIIIMWDNSDTETFDNIPNLVVTIESILNKEKFKNMPVFLVQNKIDLELNDSRASKPEEQINKEVSKLKSEYPNITHYKLSLLDKDDYPTFILEIDRKLSNQDKKNKEPFESVRFKYPFNFVESENNKEYKKNSMNIALLGDSNTGKTTFIYYLDEKPIDNIISTVGINDYLLFGDIYDEKVKIKLIDTAGQERYNSLSTDPIKKAHGFLIFFDVTKEETFYSIDKYISTITNYNESNKIILLGNKIDEKDRKIRKQDAKKYAEKNGIKYFECSSKYGINILEVLNEIVSISFERYNEMNEKNEINEVNRSKNLTFDKTENNKSGGCCS